MLCKGQDSTTLKLILVFDWYFSNEKLSKDEKNSDNRAWWISPQGLLTVLKESKTQLTWKELCSKLDICLIMNLFVEKNKTG